MYDSINQSIQPPITSTLQDGRLRQKLFRVDRHVLVGVTGMTADALALVRWCVWGGVVIWMCVVLLCVFGVGWWLFGCCVFFFFLGFSIYSLGINISIALSILRVTFFVFVCVYLGVANDERGTFSPLIVVDVGLQAAGTTQHKSN